MDARAESDADFYGRRALEESRAAATASCPRIGAAHRRLAAAYSARVQAEVEVQEQLAEMLAELDRAADFAGGKGSEISAEG